MPYSGTWSEVPPAAEMFRHDLLTVAGRGAPYLPLPSPAAGLSVTGDGVVMTSLRVRDGRQELRVVALSDTPAEAVIEGAFGQARRADLRGRPGEELPVADGVLRLPLGAWEIATVQLANSR
jgi:alpha-mannosidase